MKQLVIAVFLVSLLLRTYSQGGVVMEDKPFILYHKIDSSLLAKLSRNEEYTLLKSHEKEGLYWIALMRSDPPKFAREIVNPFLKQFPEVNNGAARSLIRDLSVQQSMGILFPRAYLKRSADLQANYLLGRDKLIHTGPKGKTFQQRMGDVGVRECAGENLFEGKADPLVSLLLLLIDNGVPGYGHRKTLLNPAFSGIGISMLVEEGGRMLMVQDFSCN